MRENYIKKVLETLKNEGDIEITFIDARGNETKINQYEHSAVTCMYKNGESIPRYYNINKNNEAMVYEVFYGEFTKTVEYGCFILYSTFISYTVKYL